MNKLISFSLLAVTASVSLQAQAFKFDTSDDWAIRWDNRLKGNLMYRVENQDPSVYDPQRAVPSAAAAVADDSTYSVRKNKFVSERVDLLSEFDLVWKDALGFRVSAAAWYDHGYSGHNNGPRTGPTKAFPAADSTWGSLSVGPGKWTSKAKDLHYRGSELLDAFVFANFDVGDVAANVRIGRHTLYWGQSFLTLGAIHGFAGSMAAIDVSKGFGAPGTEVKELFIPNEKISTVWQFTDKLSVSAYYATGFEPLRWPEGGTYFSLAEVLTENSEFFTVIPGGETSSRAGFIATDYKSRDSGDWGINIQYYFESLDLETAFIYLNNTDRLTSGLYSTTAGDNLGSDELALAANANATLIGRYGWVYKDDIDTFGVSLSKQMWDISWGADFIYRNNNALNPGQEASLTQPYDSAGDVNPGDRYPGPTGDTVHIVANGLGFLSPDWGIWDGGRYIVEMTFSRLLHYGQFEDKANPLINKDDWNTHIGAIFAPTWYQVRPGWDLTTPLSISYAIKGKQAPNSAGGNERVGNGSAGLSIDVDQTWSMALSYNFFFGPQKFGPAAYIKDRDNVSFTVKRTF